MLEPNHLDNKPTFYCHCKQLFLISLISGPKCCCLRPYAVCGYLSQARHHNNPKCELNYCGHPLITVIEVGQCIMMIFRVSLPALILSAPSVDLTLKDQTIMFYWVNHFPHGTHFCRPNLKVEVISAYCSVLQLL